VSYCRFLGADAYIFESSGGWIECCGCSLAEIDDDEVFGFFHANTAREMLEHMDKHREAGDYIPERAYDGIKADNPDLDKQIEKYVPKRKTNDE
jgi:hypothetical protein